MLQMPISSAARPAQISQSGNSDQWNRPPSSPIKISQFQ